MEIDPIYSNNETAKILELIVEKKKEKNFN
jgi:hypothetical protein